LGHSLLISFFGTLPLTTKSARALLGLHRQTGLEFRDANFLLSNKNGKPLAEGMVVNLSVAFQGLEDPKNKSQTYVYDAFRTGGQQVILTLAHLPQLQSTSHRYCQDRSRERYRAH
jgi:nucleosome binding factor SPN SPT16 subunit